MNSMAASDVLFIGLIVFILAMGFFAINFGTNTVLDKVKVAPVVNGTPEMKEAIENTQDKLNTAGDYITFALFIAFCIGMMVTAWLVGGMPIFMFLYFLFVVISVVVGSFLSYFWTTITQASVFGLTITHFGLSNHLVSNIHIYLAVLGTIGIIVMFAKPAPQGG